MYKSYTHTLSMVNMTQLPSGLHFLREWQAKQPQPPYRAQL